MKKERTCSMILSRRPAGSLIWEYVGWSTHRVHCQMDRYWGRMRVQDKELVGEDAAEAAEAVKAKVEAEAATAMFANASAEAAAGVPQRVSTLWHHSAHLKRGSEQQDRMLGRTSSYGNG